MDQEFKKKRLEIIQQMGEGEIGRLDAQVQISRLRRESAKRRKKEKAQC